MCETVEEAKQLAFGTPGVRRKVGRTMRLENWPTVMVVRLTEGLGYHYETTEWVYVCSWTLEMGFW